MGRRKITTEEFIEKAIAKHGNKYNYDNVVYVKSNLKVIIRCYRHGDFEQTPNNHLNSGCVKCGRNIINFKNKKNISDVIRDFKRIHGDKYNYSLVEYKKWNLNIKIKCNIHGVFDQTPNKHLNGNGCYKCGRDSISIKNGINPTTWGFSKWCYVAGKSKDFDSFKVYIIRCWNNQEDFYKIGRTYRSTKYRFKSKIDLPYNYEIVKELVFNKHKEMIDNARDCFYKEIDLKRVNKESKYTPTLFFKGMQECFYKINFDILN